jgi:Protein of unknown function (DUF3126)
LNQNECARLGAYLSKLLGSPTVSVVPNGPDAGSVLVDGGAVAGVSKDDEDGELSYFVSLEIARASGVKKGAPIDDAERKRLEGVLKQKLHAAGLEVRPRPRKSDSAEVYVGDEFIGTISADDDAGYFLTMIVLGFDLDEA